MFNLLHWGWFFTLSWVIFSSTYPDLYSTRELNRKLCKSLNLYFYVAPASAVLCLGNTSHLGPLPTPQLCLFSSERPPGSPHIPPACIVCWKLSQKKMGVIVGLPQLFSSLRDHGYEQLDVQCLKTAASIFYLVI